MNTKFRATPYEIQEIHVVSETDKTVTFIRNGRSVREKKLSAYSSWHNTKQEAKEYLISVQDREIDHLENSKQYAIKRKNEIINY